MSDKPSPKPSAGKRAFSTPLPKNRSAIDVDEPLDFLGKPQGPDELGRLAHYRVLRVLGKGGMGIVFMAEDTRLHRTVALKVMLPSIAKKAVARDRFLREARATAAIEHDHIVTIYHVSEPNEAVPYLAMQFLKGMTLEDWLKAGKKLNVPQVMRISKEIARALAAAHDRKLIHRDIKPSNVWLDAVNRGRVKILDFGLARPTNEETHLTQEGMILGSPAYMAPEQARGEEVDERCDLFSLGCVMYRLLAGRLPFIGKDTMAMLLELTSREPPPLAELNPDVPPALAELVHRLLAKKPADRPASAKDVVQAIQDIERAWVAGGKTVAEAPSRPKPAKFDDKDIDVEPVLEDSAIAELELERTPGPDEPTRGRGWLYAALAGLFACAASVVCCVGIAVGTDFGYVEVDAADDTAAKLVEGAGLAVRDSHHKLHMLALNEPVKLPAGEYEIDTANLPNSLQFEPSKFAVKRWETVRVAVTHVAPKLFRPALALITAADAKRVRLDWAGYLKRDADEINSIGMKLSLIPPGEFMMGSTDEQVSRYLGLKKFEKKLAPDGYAAQVNSEKPRHKVRISKPFYLGATEVTVGQFTKFTNDKKAPGQPVLGKDQGGQGIEPGKEQLTRKPEYNWKNPGFTQGNEQPVCNLTWKDAEAFCDWLSKKEGKRYRLPTEAEWEYACRAGTTTAWNFGDEPKSLPDRPWSLFPVKEGKEIKLTTHPVAKKPANDFGLFDMHGNVAEMCSDSWDLNYYAACAKDAVTIDPQGPKAAPKAPRVIRGGSFHDSIQAARSAYRNGADPALGYVTIGFRVVLEAPLPAE